MSNKYKLSQSGIDRLNRFKRDIENGDFKIVYQRHFGKLLYFTVSSGNELSTACVFDLDESKIAENAIAEIEKALNGKVRHKFDSNIGCDCFYSPGHVGITKSDVELSNA